MKPIKEILFRKINSVRVIAELASYIDSLEEDKDYSLAIYEKRKKRSLSANAYFWTMISDLAAKIRIPKEDIYREYIRQIGGNSEEMRLKTEAIPYFEDKWAEGHIGRFVDVIEDYSDGYSDIIVYYGSSDYDRTQMSRLIEMCKQDCAEQGIKTYNDEELERLIQEWGV